MTHPTAHPTVNPVALPEPGPLLSRAGWSAFLIALLVVCALAPLLNLVVPEGHPLHLSDYLVGLLKLTDGNVADAARLAERNRTEFYRLLQKHDLTPGLFKSEGSAPDGSEPVADS